MYTRTTWLIAIGVGIAIGAGARPASADLLIQGIDGPVTAAEIDAFERHMMTVEPGGSNRGNNYVYGNGGKSLEGLGEMYEVTGDTAILDRMIYFADRMLAGRNDRSERRTIWTGRVEPCWPNKPATAADGAYCGTENGDVVGHIAFCARLILETPALWNQRVAIGDPEHHGATYLERARTFVAEGDKTAAWLTTWFVNADSKRFYLPRSPGFAALGPRYEKDQGHGVPWNQQMMLASGFQRLAESHALLRDDARKTRAYDAIVKASMGWFQSELQSYRAGDRDAYKWSYATGDVNLRYMEDAGHGGYDIWGLWKAAQRSSYHIRSRTLRQLAQTVRFVMAGSDGKFAGRVDGRGGRKAYLGSTFLLLAKYDPALFPVLANRALLSQAKNRMDVAARILWMKHLRSGGFDAAPASEATGDTEADEAAVGGGEAELGALAGADEEIDDVAAEDDDEAAADDDDLSGGCRVGGGAASAAPFALLLALIALPRWRRRS